MSDAAAERARSEAAAWFARLNKVSVSTDTLREFRDWKRRNGNAAAYEQLEATWDAAGRLAPDPDIQALTSSVLSRRGHGRGRAILHRRAALGVGGLALLAGAALAAWLALQPRFDYRTGVGEQQLVTLADGSRVRLNTDSALRVRISDRERRVELARGEAFFDVKHDAARPFIVLANGAQIVDVGTQFDVRQLAGGVQVTLLQGEVRVSAPGSRTSATLAPDQQIRVTREGASTPTRVDAAEAASWTTGRLIFHGSPLAEAVAEVNRYSTRKIVLDAPADLAQRPVSGAFNTGDTDAFMAAVTALLPLRSTVDSNGAVRLTPAAYGAG